MLIHLLLLLKKGYGYVCVYQYSARVGVYGCVVKKSSSCDQAHAWSSLSHRKEIAVDKGNFLKTTVDQRLGVAMDTCEVA